MSSTNALILEGVLTDCTATYGVLNLYQISEVLTNKSINFPVIVLWISMKQIMTVCTVKEYMLAVAFPIVNTISIQNRAFCKWPVLNEFKWTHTDILSNILEICWSDTSQSCVWSMPFAIQENDANVNLDWNCIYK